MCDGRFRETPSGNMSAILKPQSAIIASPDSTSNPLARVNFLSEIFLLYKSDIKLIAPDGVIPINALCVVMFVRGKSQLLG